MTVENPRPKQLRRPIITGANSAMSQSQFLAITCNSLKAREKWRVHGATGFGFASHWLKNWRESFKPITKRSNRNHLITFESHLKTALTRENWKIVIIMRLCRPRNYKTRDFTASKEREQQWNVQKWKLHVQSVQKYCFSLLNMQICDVLVTVIA